MNAFLSSLDLSSMEDFKKRTFNHKILFKLSKKTEYFFYEPAQQAPVIVMGCELTSRAYSLLHI